MQITIREPGSAITHFIGMLLAVFASTPLLIKAAQSADPLSLSAMFIFIVSMVLLYAASTFYHSVNFSGKLLSCFRKLDHMMIFVLIAGSYTPVCLLVLKGRSGMILLVIVWALAIIGMIGKAVWVTCPKWFSSVIYISLGWSCLGAFRQLVRDLSPWAFFWLLTGGLLYTAGGIIYAGKFSLLNDRHPNFGSHEIFHLFVMAGSLCHFVFMFCILL